MVANQKVTGTASSLPEGIAIGAGTSIAITFIAILIVAKLIDSGTMQENAIGYSAIGILLIASISGSIVSSRRIRRKHILVCGLSGITYFLTLLAMTALFFGGQYDGITVTLLMILCGSGVAILLGKQKGRGPRKPSYHKLWTR